MRLNAYGHSLRASALSPDELSPKSSLTATSPAAADEDPDAAGADSDVDLPRNSQRDVRAKPCCGSFEVAAWSGAVPNT